MLCLYISARARLGEKTPRWPICEKTPRLTPLCSMLYASIFPRALCEKTPRLTPPMLYADADSARALDVLLMMQRLSLPPFLTLCLERALPPSLPVRANSHVACADQEGGDSLR